MILFESDRFQPYLPDECQVNPNALGFELAAWLSRALAAKGFVTSYPVSEDWGWFLERLEGNEEYMICCSGAAVQSGYEWRIFVTRPRRFFRKRAHNDRSDELLQTISALLQETGITVQSEVDP